MRRRDYLGHGVCGSGRGAQPQQRLPTRTGGPVRCGERSQPWARPVREAAAWLGARPATRCWPGEGARLLARARGARPPLLPGGLGATLWG
jgi:hypothetical protein